MYYVIQCVNGVYVLEAKEKKQQLACGDITPEHIASGHRSWTEARAVATAIADQHNWTADMAELDQPSYVEYSSQFLMGGVSQC